MEVKDGVVADAWVSATLFRGMELILEGREPTDAAYITQRICGVCPVSHAHAASMAAEDALDIKIPNGARLIRNIIEGSQFLHSHILWFYNLAGLDYVNPLNALKANPKKALQVALDAGTSISDFGAVQKRLEAFAENGQLSIFSGHWFDGKDEAYKLTPELDLICTTHYLEALEMQAVASEISSIVGGKMPHVMSAIPGGSTWMPTAQNLDDILFRAIRLRDWIKATMIPDTYAIAPFYLDVAGYGAGPGRYIAWGVFNREDLDPANRYLPAGVWGFDESLAAPDEDAITEETVRAFYKDSGEPVNPRQGITDPEFPDDAYSRDGRYSWSKAPRYNGKPYEAGGLSRLLVAYNSGNDFVTEKIDDLLDYLSSAAGTKLGPEALNSTLGRTAARNIETWYIAECLIEWIGELIEAISEGGIETFAKATKSSGEGTGMWEAPRGALYHHEKVTGNKIDAYQIIIPSTWNASPRSADGARGPMEEALVGVPVADLEKPIHALRTVHSFDPCIACAVHITEPATGKTFSTVTSPWGVK
ncbi:MAG: nickel-dependent hydrogenase large subunit [Coriobacteriia bacterium]|nr:nickel-dependent hydrogenase large subunit [Coriobacteriia bacterium]